MIVFKMQKIHIKPLTPRPLESLTPSYQLANTRAKTKISQTGNSL